jgi:electron transport complex protein RnfC
VSTSLHAPVTGRVADIGPRRHPFGPITAAIVIDADPFDPQRLPEATPVDPSTLDAAAFVAEVQRAGMVGLGGAAFPSHVKYAVKEGQPINRLVINGAECEPYLTCDHRMMVERPEAVLRGTQILADHLGVESVYIGVEENKPEAIAALESAREACPMATVRPLRVKYPQGAEKMLIQAILGLTVPAGKLPLHLGIVVNNVGTMASLADWFDRRQPLIERLVTVSGPGIRRPANLLVPLGTPVRDLIERCGGLLPETRMLVMGGPMMGQPLSSVDVPVLKGTSGILALTDEVSGLPPEYPCVRCARCLEACPAFLNPSRLARLARAGRAEEAATDYHIVDCMECGACSYACPSGIPIVQLIRSAKAELRRKR